MKKRGNCDGEGSEVWARVYRMDKMFYLPKGNKREIVEPSQFPLPKAAENAKKNLCYNWGKPLGIQERREIICDSQNRCPAKRGTADKGIVS